MLIFIVMTLAVALGSLLSLGVLLLLVLNKKVLKAYVKWATKVSVEIQNEILKNLEREEI